MGSTRRNKSKTDFTATDKLKERVLKGFPRRYFELCYWYNLIALLYFLGERPVSYGWGLVRMQLQDILHWNRLEFTRML